MGFWRAIDWQRPWLAPYRALGEAAVRRLEAGDTVAAALNRVLDPADGAGPARGAGAWPDGSCVDRPRLAASPLRFVPHDALPRREAYEAFIARTATVPTRDDGHDFFNGLVWLRWPAIKRRLNGLQVAQIGREGVGATRGPLRDALTLLDENGALWAPPAAFAQALAAHDWQALFLAERGAWRHVAPPVLFGHALLDKLAQPRPPITAHVLLLPPVDLAEATVGHAALAEAALARLAPERLPAKPFHPLPVLGVPGWWPANESPDFYADTGVFRPSNSGAMRQSHP